MGIVGLEENAVASNFFEKGMQRKIFEEGASPDLLADVIARVLRELGLLDPYVCVVEAMVKGLLDERDPTNATFDRDQS